MFYNLNFWFNLLDSKQHNAARRLFPCVASDSTEVVPSSGYLCNLCYWITKKCVGDSTFGAAAPRLWNELPVNIRASGTLPIFRKYLKTYLFSRHFN